MNKLIKKIRETEGTNVVFKAAKPQDGDIILIENRRKKPKGMPMSGAAKMKAAYKKRKATKSSSKKKR